MAVASDLNQNGGCYCGTAFRPSERPRAVVADAVTPAVTRMLGTMQQVRAHGIIAQE
jgi:hypothetical protein